MTEDMRTEALDIIVGGVEKYPDNMEAACKLIKETMDKKFGGPWHVRGSPLNDHRRRLILTRCCGRSLAQAVAGEGFGFTVQYEAKHLCYTFFGGTGRLVAILLFKSCVL